MKHRLSVIIPCKDEAHNIHRCVESVRPIADEILVADSGSTDGTLEIVRELEGCRLIEREFITPADFKNWAIPQAAHEWVMICDADERPDSTLIREINELLDGNPTSDGYQIRASIYFLGHPIRYSGQNTAVKLALFRRDLGRFCEKRVHEDCDVASGKLGKLQGRLDHYSCQCLDRFVQTQNRYSTWAALDMYEHGRTVGFLGVLTRPVLRFLQFYVIRGGYLDGPAGFLSCAMVAYYNFLKYAKLWELHHSRTLFARSVENPTSCVSETQVGEPDHRHCAA